MLLASARCRTARPAQLPRRLPLRRSHASPRPARPSRQALQYQGRIRDALPAGSGFNPLMTLYLTDNTPPEEVWAAREAGVVAAKLYPAGATTNSGAPLTAFAPACRSCCCCCLRHHRDDARAHARADSGVTDFKRVLPTLAAMAEAGLLLLVHGEVTDADVDMFDREAVFIDQKLVGQPYPDTAGRAPLECCMRSPHPAAQQLPPCVCRAAHKLRLRCALLAMQRVVDHTAMHCCCGAQKPLLDVVPQLKVVLEHITTADAAEFVVSAPANVAASVTPQHMLLNRNALFAVSCRRQLPSIAWQLLQPRRHHRAVFAAACMRSPPPQKGLRPHNYCLPILKRERHREAVAAAATSGSAKFFLGTDSAPHALPTKEAACGCAGVFSAPIALPLYATAFEQV